MNTIDDFSDLFSRSLKRMSQSKPGTRTSDQDSTTIHYTYNSHGYRSEEFKDQEILTLGCSQTLGLGLPLEYTWPFLLSEKMNMPYANLAKGGDSMQGQVIKAFQFFKEFNNPKYIFGVFPLTRMEMPYVKDTFAVTKNPKVLDEDIDKKYIQNIFLRNTKLEKFSKLPHAGDEVIPEEVAIFYNMMFIQMLDQYCKTNQIKFLWTYYEDSTYKIENQIDLNSYFEGSFLDKEKKGTCHVDYRKNPLFHQAADYSKVTKMSHWGFHTQIHIAENIYGML